MVVLAAAVAETPRGWDNTIGIGVGLVVIYLIWRADKWWRERKAPSPAETGAPLPREIPQVRAVSSHVSGDETRDETAPAGWWGRIENVNGSLRRVYQTARHVTQTGYSPPPDDTVPDAISDDEIEFDLPLDDGESDADHGGADRGDGPLGVGWTSDDPNIGRLTIDNIRETREEYVTRCIEEDVPKPKIVAALQEHYDLSRATAYRVVDAAAARRPAA